MAKHKNANTAVEEALEGMKEGQLKMITVSPGRTGKILLRKGKGTATGFQIETIKRSKVVPSPLTKKNK